MQNAAIVLAGFCFAAAQMWFHDWDEVPNGYFGMHLFCLTGINSMAVAAIGWSI